MTAIATPASARPLWHRLVSAGVVILGGVFWIGGAFFFTLFAGRWHEVYERFEIRGGLPYPTQLLMNLETTLSGHWTATCALCAVAVLLLALVAATVRWRCAPRLAGWFAVACFFSWYVVLVASAVAGFMPLH